MLVFDPTFNPKEVTFKSASCVDCTVAECTKKQALHRSMASNAGASSGPPLLVLDLVVSEIYRYMLPFEEDI